MAEPTDRNFAAIMTARTNEPLLYAERSEPVDPLDSGWQFSSEPSGGGDPDDAQIWLVDEVLKREPSLEGFIDLPYGTILRRRSAGQEWQATAS